MAGQPVDVLTTPEPSDPVPDLVEIGLGFNLISPTWYVQQFLSTVIGLDPLDWIAQQVAGNWEDVQRAGAAIQNLGKYNEALAESIRSGAHGVQQSWHGNAAENADAYFEDLANAVDAQVKGLGQIGDQINLVAFSMYEGAKGLGDAFQTLCDSAVIALAEAAAGDALALTVAGGPAAAACWAASAVQVTYILIKWGKTVEHWNECLMVIEGMLAGILGTVGGAEFIDLPALPTAAYDNPGA